MATKTVVYAEDMTDDMMNRAIQTAQEALKINVQAGSVFTTIANHIRKSFDKEYGGSGWNCVVGSSFGSFVTHQIKTYIFFSIVPGVSILLWRS